MKIKSTLSAYNDALIEELKIKGIQNQIILSAIKKIPRELFVEKHLISEAYKNIPLPIGCRQTTSQPYVIAYMLSCLNIKKTNKVLEIGTGTGYQTAILSHLCKEVCSIELFGTLLNKAKKNLDLLNIKNINFKLGDGNKGWESKDLFDAIIVSAASKIIPVTLLKNLKENGCLIMPKESLLGNQKLLLIRKKDTHYNQEELFPVKFVPLLNKMSDLNLKV
tara:strand:- start:84 stop:746 length:663 start_codon:yes stop_codon:yes gene_type:complete